MNHFITHYSYFREQVTVLKATNTNFILTDIRLSHLVVHLHGQVLKLCAVGVLIIIYKSLARDADRANVDLCFSHIFAHCKMEEGQG